MLVVPSDAIYRMIAELIKVGSFLDACTLHLFKSQFAPSRQTQLADLLAIECDFAGYGPKPLGVWGAEYLDPAGNWGVAAPSVQFLATDDTKPNNIFGYFLTAQVAANPAVVLAEAFVGGPYAASRAGQGILCVIHFTMTDLASALAEQL